MSWKRKRGIWVVGIRPLEGSFENRDHVERWLESFRPESVEGDRVGFTMRLVRLPPEWESLDEAADVEQVELAPAGQKGRVRLRADGGTLQAIRRADAQGRPFILEKFAPIQRPRLTPRQRYLLHSALDWGYYDVPRRITLERMANELGVGLNTLSVVLRNAEASLVRNFVAFDEKPSASAKRQRSEGAEPAGS